MPNGILPTVGLTDDGSMLGAGTRLMRLSAGTRRLAFEADRDRLFALLSVARGQPVRPAEVLPAVEAASRHWQAGDKALANLRLVFSGLPRCTDRAAADRLSLAGDVLDGGLAPEALMRALWPDALSDALRRYNPAEPRVPAGQGVISGEWEVGGAGAAAPRPVVEGRFVVAAGEKPPPPKELSEQERRILEGGGPAGSVPVMLVDPLTGLPGGGLSGMSAQVSAAAKAAAATVGPGRGPVYGTAVHTEFKARVRSLDSPALHAEESYKDGDYVL